jgi:hypothetical protein
MRRLLDSENDELRTVLETLLSEDVDITIREVARRHPSLHNASAFTRNPVRLALIEQVRKRQLDARNVKNAPERARYASAAEQLKERNLEIAELERRVKALVASHAACVRAVMLHGGMGALQRFWNEYRSIGDRVRELGAIPEGGEVANLPKRFRKV